MRQVRTAIKIFLLLIVLCIAISYISAMKYPRVVRSAYYKRPHLTLCAFYNEQISHKECTQKEAIKKVKDLGLVVEKDPKYLYLAQKPNPNVDRPIVHRYFAMVTKYGIDTKENEFWEICLDEGLVYVEINSGRLILLKEDANHDYMSAPIYYD